jgi:hypothetical protein
VTKYFLALDQLRGFCQTCQPQIKRCKIFLTAYLWVIITVPVHDMYVFPLFRINPNTTRLIHVGIYTRARGPVAVVTIRDHRLPHSMCFIFVIRRLRPPVVGCETRLFVVEELLEERGVSLFRICEKLLAGDETDNVAERRVADKIRDHCGLTTRRVGSYKAENVSMEGLRKRPIRRSSMVYDQSKRQASITKPPDAKDFTV